MPCTERQLAYSREYRKKHREILSKYQLEYYHKNAYIKEYSRVNFNKNYRWKKECKVFLNILIDFI